MGCRFDPISLFFQDHPVDVEEVFKWVEDQDTVLRDHLKFFMADLLTLRLGRFSLGRFNPVFRDSVIQHFTCDAEHCCCLLLVPIAFF
jgi:hypothetical protein